MQKRLNLVVDEDVSEMLAQLAGGERKRGAYLSSVIRSLHVGQMNVDGTNELEALRILVQNLMGRVKVLEGRLSVMKAPQN